jgi:membrane protein YdbS with pleckstrin-like domain
VYVLRHGAVLLSPGLRAGALLAGLLFLWVNTGAGTFAGVLEVAMLVVLGWFGFKIAEWRHNRFVVTDKRVLLVTGLITQRVGMMPLLKVTDMTYERSWLGRRLGYGAFVMESAGQEQALHRVDHVPQPDEVSQTMFALIFGAPAGGTLPDDRQPQPGASGGEALLAPPRTQEYSTDPDLPVIGPSDSQPPAPQPPDPEPRNVRVLGERDSTDPPGRP